jgi:hypothetical protein
VGLPIYWTAHCNRMRTFALSEAFVALLSLPRSTAQSTVHF